MGLTANRPAGQAAGWQRAARRSAWIAPATAAVFLTGLLCWGAWAAAHHPAQFYAERRLDARLAAARPQRGGAVRVGPVARRRPAVQLAAAAVRAHRRADPGRGHGDHRRGAGHRGADAVPGRAERRRGCGLGAQPVHRPARAGLRSRAAHRLPGHDPAGPAARPGRLRRRHPGWRDRRGGRAVAAAGRAAAGPDGPRRRGADRPGRHHVPAPAAADRGGTAGPGGGDRTGSRPPAAPGGQGNRRQDHDRRPHVGACPEAGDRRVAWLRTPDAVRNERRGGR